MPEWRLWGATMKREEHDTAVEQCPACGAETAESEAKDMLVECTDCMWMQPAPIDVDLPPCWKESDHPENYGANRLFLHLDGPGFIAVHASEAILVRAELAVGETPDPERVGFTAESVRQLAETYNDEFYGGELAHG